MKAYMPVETTSGMFGGYKLLAAIVAAVTPLVGIALMLSYIPLDAKDPHRDFIKRVLGCLVSSFTAGPASVIYVYRNHHSFFQVAAEGADLATGIPELGVIWLVGVILLACAVPGWIIIGGIMKTLSNMREQTLPEMVKSAADEVRSAVDAVKD